MSQWVKWNDLTSNQQEELLDLVNKFADRLIAARSTPSSVDGVDPFAMTGTALDKEMETFQHLVGPLIYDVQGKDFAINRWRAVLINDPSIYNVFAQKELAKAKRKKEADQKKRANMGGDGHRVAVAVETTAAATATAASDGDDTAQTKVNCMLCVKASFTRPKGSRGLAGLPSTWNGCDKCKKQMCCAAVHCQAQLGMHAKYCVAVK